MLEILGKQSKELALLCLETRVGPSFCNNMELVRRNDQVEETMRAGFLGGMRASLGVPKKSGEDRAQLNLQPLAAETEIAPWDIQVKAQTVRLAGKLRQGQVVRPQNKQAGELGKALATEKLRVRGLVGDNRFLLQGAVPVARKWQIPKRQPGRRA